MSVQDPIIGRYLSQFRAGLRGLPESERTEVAQEIESHIAEALAAGRSLAEVLERLGPADRLARAYTADAILSRGKPTLRGWLRAAVVLAGFSVASLFVIPFLGVCSTFVAFSVFGALANVTQFLLPGTHDIGGTYITGASPLTTLLLGLLFDVIAFFLGLGAYKLLKWYIRLLISSVRKAWVQ
jgi:uncharacterized membrane protein